MGDPSVEAYRRRFGLPEVKSRWDARGASAGSAEAAPADAPAAQPCSKPGPARSRRRRDAASREPVDWFASLKSPAPPPLTPAPSEWAAGLVFRSPNLSAVKRGRVGKTPVTAARLNVSFLVPASRSIPSDAGSPVALAATQLDVSQRYGDRSFGETQCDPSPGGGGDLDQTVLDDGGGDIDSSWGGDTLVADESPESALTLLSDDNDDDDDDDDLTDDNDDDALRLSRAPWSPAAACDDNEARSDEARESPPAGRRPRGRGRRSPGDLCSLFDGLVTQLPSPVRASSPAACSPAGPKSPQVPGSPVAGSDYSHSLARGPATSPVRTPLRSARRSAGGRTARSPGQRLTGASTGACEDDSDATRLDSARRGVGHGGNVLGEKDYDDDEDEAGDDSEGSDDSSAGSPVLVGPDTVRRLAARRTAAAVAGVSAGVGLLQAAARSPHAGDEAAALRGRAKPPDTWRRGGDDSGGGDDNGRDNNDVDDWAGPIVCSGSPTTDYGPGHEPVGRTSPTSGAGRAAQRGEPCGKPPPTVQRGQRPVHGRWGGHSGSDSGSDDHGSSNDCGGGGSNDCGVDDDWSEAWENDRGWSGNRAPPRRDRERGRALPREHDGKRGERHERRQRGNSGGRDYGRVATPARSAKEKASARLRRREDGGRDDLDGGRGRIVGSGCGGSGRGGSLSPGSESYGSGSGGGGEPEVDPEAWVRARDRGWDGVSGVIGRVRGGAVVFRDGWATAAEALLACLESPPVTPGRKASKASRVLGRNRGGHGGHDGHDGPVTRTLVVGGRAALERWRQLLAAEAPHLTVLHMG